MDPHTKQNEINIDVETGLIIVSISMQGPSAHVHLAVCLVFGHVIEGQIS